MTKAELIADIAKRAEISPAQAKVAVEAFVAAVTASLKRGEEVRLMGFGSFTPVAKPAGLVRNPKTGVKAKRAASRTAKFRIGESLKSALN